MDLSSVVEVTSCVFPRRSIPTEILFAFRVSLISFLWVNAPINVNPVVGGGGGGGAGKGWGFDKF